MILCTLYLLNIDGAGLCAHLTQTFSYMGFRPSYGDRGVWIQAIYLTFSVPYVVQRVGTSDI